MTGFPPGTLAIEWDSRIVHIRSLWDDYWYSSNALAVGQMRLLDETVTPEKYEIIVPTGSGWRRVTS